MKSLLLLSGVMLAGIPAHPLRAVESACSSNLDAAVPQAQQGTPKQTPPTPGTPAPQPPPKPSEPRPARPNYLLM